MFSSSLHMKIGEHDSKIFNFISRNNGIISKNSSNESLYKILIYVDLKYTRYYVKLNVVTWNIHVMWYIDVTWNILRYVKYSCCKFNVIIILGNIEVFWGYRTDRMRPCVRPTKEGYRWPCLHVYFALKHTTIRFFLSIIYFFIYIFLIASTIRTFSRKYLMWELYDVCQ